MLSLMNKCILPERWPELFPESSYGAAVGLECVPHSVVDTDRTRVKQRGNGPLRRACCLSQPSFLEWLLLPVMMGGHCPLLMPRKSMEKNTSTEPISPNTPFTSSKHVNVHAFGDVISCCTLDSSGSLVLREGGTSNKVKSESKMGREAPTSQTLDSSRASRLRLHISTGQGGSKVPTHPGCSQNNSVKTSGMKPKCQ